MKKLIGISSKRIEVPDLPDHMAEITSYFDAVEKAGGLAVMIPMVQNLDLIPEIVERLDGVILSGGSDIDPRLYEEDPHPKLGNVNYLRDLFELKVLESALEKEIPILGICRGLQLANIHFGGSLYQDIFSQKEGVIGHDNASMVPNLNHKVEIKSGSFAEEIFQKGEIFVNSIHHQAIKELGEGLEAVAHSSDGLIEMVVDLERKFVGTQFHPEESVNDPVYGEAYTKLFQEALKL